jgi:ion channel-forming bestrophin family protein
MIVKKVFNPILVIYYLRKELIISILFSTLVFLAFEIGAYKHFKIPFSIASILGSALAIFIAFRNNNAYNRWWEARTIWGSIINNSRIFARQIIANAENAVNTGKATSEKALAFQKELIYRQIAFAHSLRLVLRKQKNYEEFSHLINAVEFNKLIQKQNIPNTLLLTQGIRIKEAIKDEILGGFDNISLEPTLAGFGNFQGACERIKNTPLLRQYHFFTNLFLQVFMLMLPLSLIDDFSKIQMAWAMIPLSVLISFVFGVMARVGEVNENPFENSIVDVPLTALCNTIERDLREMLGESDIPAKVEVVNGYLY